MFQTKPACFNDFQCIGSDCKDNCCIGWEIDIDEESLDFYQKQKGTIGKRLKDNIVFDETPHFLLPETERCPFLNSHNLCDLIIELGEDAICDICTEHPRFYNIYGDYREKGWGLCCEEAVRLLLCDKDKLCFLTEEIEDDYVDEWPDDDLWNIVYPMRNLIIRVLQERNYSIEERMCVAASLAEQTQVILDDDCDVEWEKISEFYADCRNWNKVIPAHKTNPLQCICLRYKIGEILKLFQTLEVMNPEWTCLLKEMEKTQDAVWRNAKHFQEEFRDQEYAYEHILVYFVYRYVLNAVWDGDFLTKVEFCILSCLFIMAMDIHSWFIDEFSTNKREEHVKNFSKEIEYSTENVRLIEEFLCGLKGE